MDWIRQHSAELQVLISILTAVIWLVYLQLLLSGFLRQRRSVILINRSASHDENARCFITNMGSEPVYLIDVVARLRFDGETREVIVTDRDELGADDVRHPAERTNQGPIDSGAFVDVGSFADLFQRAENRLGRSGLARQVEWMELIVAAASGHATHVVAARRRFDVSKAGGELRFVPTGVLTRQIRGFRERRAVAGMVRERLQ